MILILFFCSCLLLHAAYWAMLSTGFRRQGRSARGEQNQDGPPISVVVAARNEADNLPILLDALAGQQYTNFEVIVVDDGSTDSTAELVASRAEADERFRLVRSTPAEPRKKNALATGIRHARFERLAFTDADCHPGPAWLSSISAFGLGDSIVVGYSPFKAAPGLVNRVSRYETFVTGFLTAAAIGLNRPYMAVGRNLSYTRRLFNEIGGYEHSLHVLSGDDDLLIQEAAEYGARVVHMAGNESFVETSAPESWSEWVRQKRRHASAGRYYRAPVKAHLILFHLTGHALWLAPILTGLPGLLLLAARLLIQRFALARPASDFGERDLLALLPVWELFYTLQNVLLAPLGLLFPPRAWRTGAERQQ